MICKHNFNGRYCEKFSDGTVKEPCIDAPCAEYEPAPAKLNAEFEEAFQSVEGESNGDTPQNPRGGV